MIEEELFKFNIVYRRYTAEKGYFGPGLHFSESSNPKKKCRGGKHNHDMSDTIIICMALHRECGKCGRFEKVRVGVLQKKSR